MIQASTTCVSGWVILGDSVGAREIVLRRTQGDLIVRIHIEHSDRGSARGCLTDHMDSLQPEMFVPLLPSRVKQLRNFARFRIDSSQIRSFVQIAIDAGKSQVVEDVASAMSFWNDVFDVKSGQRRIILTQMTILASVLGALADLGSGLRSDHLGLGVGKLLCLAFKNGDELVRAHIACVLGPLIFGEFACG